MSRSASQRPQGEPGDATREQGSSPGSALRHAAGWAIAAAAFAASTAWALRRIRLGIDLTDEGLYLAAPLRYALGDVPFRDEITNPSRMYDLVLAPVFAFAPGISVYELRLLWLLVQLVAALALFGLMRRFAPAPLVALAAASTMWFHDLIWTPGYHTMSLVFFVLGWSLWLAACLPGARHPALRGAAGGAVFGVGALAYLPLLALAVVPGAVYFAAASGGAGASPRARATGGHLLGLAAPLLLFALALVVFGLAGDWFAAQRDLVSLRHYGAPLSEKAASFAQQTLRFLPVLAAAAAAVVAMVASLRLEAAWRGRAAARQAALALVLFAGAAVAAQQLLVRPTVAASQRWVDTWWALASLRVFVIGLGFHAGALLWVAWGRRAALAGGFGFVYGAWLAGTLLYAFAQGFLGGQAYKAMLGMLPLAVSAVVLLCRVFAAAAPGAVPRRLGLGYALICCACLGFGSLAARQQWVYPSGNARQLTAEFSRPRLAGLRGQPEQVRSLERLLDYLAPRLRRGDTLLAYDDVPLLYYLTQTRPALDHAWTSRAVPAKLRRRSIERMVAAGRTPAYAVRRLTPDLTAGAGLPEDVHPVDAFVWEHYQRVATLPPFEVWQLREPADAFGPTGRCPLVMPTAVCQNRSMAGSHPAVRPPERP